ncbi:MAG: hypothetical protein SGJ27_04175 [Candidatus Melainabacteria bacterium]|nr:hypothetical protein [Candidatus Melainabacteria bacterium]
MSDVKVNVYTPTGSVVGYFLNPSVQAFPEGDYEVSGEFFDADGERIQKLDFNPQAFPYTADLSDHPGAAHRKIENVYVQRGRQPVRMSGNAGIPQ